MIIPFNSIQFKGNCHSSCGAKCFDSTCPLWSVEDLMSRTVESCKGHLSLHWLHYCGPLVCEVFLCLKRPLGWKTVPTPPTPYSPHPTIPMARPAVFLCSDDRPASPRRPPPQPVPPCSGTRQHFLLSFGAFPHRFEHPSLISGISLVSLWTMRTLSLAHSPFLSVSCPLLLSCGFLFIQIFFPLFSSPSLSCSFLVFSFSPFSPSSPVGPLFSLSKMPFSSPLPLYPCSWEELETICFIYLLIYLFGLG